jgi:hypothetical protein
MALADVVAPLLPDETAWDLLKRSRCKTAAVGLAAMDALVG